MSKMYIIKHDFVKKYHAFLMFRKDLELLNLLWILYKTKTATYISRCFSKDFTCSEDEN